jgi:hypothetical protein
MHDQESFASSFDDKHIAGCYKKWLAIETKKKDSIHSWAQTPDIEDPPGLVCQIPHEYRIPKRFRESIRNPVFKYESYFSMARWIVIGQSSYDYLVRSCRNGCVPVQVMMYQKEFLAPEHWYLCVYWGHLYLICDGMFGTRSYFLSRIDPRMYPYPGCTVVQDYCSCSRICAEQRQKFIPTRSIHDLNPFG